MNTKMGGRLGHCLPSNFESFICVASTGPFSRAAYDLWFMGQFLLKSYFWIVKYSVSIPYYEYFIIFNFWNYGKRNFES